MKKLVLLLYGLITFIILCALAGGIAFIIYVGVNYSIFLSLILYCGLVALLTTIITWLVYDENDDK